ncbi:hypothetical protein F4818DRAFT_441641 [Hypoxylon cercidicola]|nr:hypothetical protein F4818DRAFT_441641 [Hypoxylon cercidicola]
MLQMIEPSRMEPKISKVAESKAMDRLNQTLASREAKVESPDSSPIVHTPSPHDCGFALQTTDESIHHRQTVDYISTVWILGRRFTVMTQVPSTPAPAHQARAVQNDQLSDQTMTSKMTSRRTSTMIASSKDEVAQSSSIWLREANDGSDGSDKEITRTSTQHSPPSSDDERPDNIDPDKIPFIPNHPRSRTDRSMFPRKKSIEIRLRSSHSRPSLCQPHNAPQPVSASSQMISMSVSQTSTMPMWNHPQPIRHNGNAWMHPQPSPYRVTMQQGLPDISSVYVQPRTVRPTDTGSRRTPP